MSQTVVEVIKRQERQEKPTQWRRCRQPLCVEVIVLTARFRHFVAVVMEIWKNAVASIQKRRSVRGPIHVHDQGNQLDIDYATGVSLSISLYYSRKVSHTQYIEIWSAHLTSCSQCSYAGWRIQTMSAVAGVALRNHKSCRFSSTS